MNRAAIYARFSTELQQERSIEDQFALCRTYAAKNGLEIVAAYEDRARSGASIYGREGLMRLLDAARERQFDIVLTEALDRLSRDQEDLAGVWKRLNFLGSVLSTKALRTRFRSVYAACWDPSFLLISPTKCVAVWTGSFGTVVIRAAALMDIEQSPANQVSWKSLKKKRRSFAEYFMIMWLETPLEKLRTL